MNSLPSNNIAVFSNSFHYVVAKGNSKKTGGKHGNIVYEKTLINK